MRAHAALQREAEVDLNIDADRHGIPLSIQA
jgi:hypothetical protein